MKRAHMQSGGRDAAELIVALSGALFSPRVGLTARCRI